MYDEPLVNEILRLIDRIDNAIERVRSALNRVLSWVPQWAAWAVDAVMSAWGRMCDFFGRLWDVLREFLSNAGSPTVLRDTGERWIEEVAGPVSSQVGLLQAGRLQSDNHWSGVAADQYKETLPQQTAALTAVEETFAQAVQKAFSAMAGALTIFWTVVAGALVALVAATHVAAGAFSTVVGAPVAVGAIVTAVVACIAAVTGATANLYNVAGNSEADLSRALADSTAFPGGSWPKAAIR